MAEVTRGKLVCLAGQVAFDLQGNLVGKDDVEAQVRQVFANLSAALKSRRRRLPSRDQIELLLRGHCRARGCLPAIKTVRDSVVNSAALPASTFVVIRKLARPELLIEVEAVAVV